MKKTMYFFILLGLVNLCGWCGPAPSENPEDQTTEQSTEIPVPPGESDIPAPPPAVQEEVLPEAYDQPSAIPSAATKSLPHTSSHRAQEAANLAVKASKVRVMQQWGLRLCISSGDCAAHLIWAEDNLKKADPPGIVRNGVYANGKRASFFFPDNYTQGFSSEEEARAYASTWKRWYPKIPAKVEKLPTEWCGMGFDPYSDERVAAW